MKTASIKFAFILVLKTFTASLTIAMAFAAYASAATIGGSFQQIDCEGGGWFEQVIPHASGRLYGRTDVGGMYRSDDHGDNWRFISGDLADNGSYYVQGVAIAAGSADILYQASGTSYAASDPGRGIWKSVNGGTSWTQVLAGVNFSGNDTPHFGGECIVVQPGNDNELWAGTRGDGLRHSIDAGANWTDVAAATFHTPAVIFAGITFHPTTPDTMWVCGEGGVWVSTNHGANWTKQINATRIYKVVVKADGTAFAAGNNGGNVLYRFNAATPLGGATNLYANYVASLPYAPGSDLAMVQLLANGDLWAADLFEFVAKSTNNGSTFIRVPTTLSGPLPGWVRPGTTIIEGGRNGLVQDPTNASRLFLGGGYAPFRSLDGGATWSFMTRGIGETVAGRVNFHPTDANRVWIPLADLGCTTISDAGASGVSSGYIAPQFPYPDDNVMFTHRLLVSAGKVIAPGGEQATHQARIYQTLNNGGTWTKLVGSGLPTANDREIIEDVASSDNPDDFLVFTASALTATEGGAYRTTNGGANFTRSTGLPVGYDPGAEFYWNVSLERDATDLAVRYLLLRNSGFWKSTNRGAAWTKPAVQPAGTFGRLRVDAVTGRVWVGHSFGLEYCDNAGASWTLLGGAGALTSVTELDAHGSRIAVIGRLTGDVSDHIYLSSNNGVSWDEITLAGNRFANAAAVAVDPWRPGTVWISTGGRSVARFSPFTPIEAWRNTYFGSPLATGNAAPLANADSDGFQNATEYVFATNPTAPTFPVPLQAIRAGGKLTVTFPRNTAAIDAMITIQGADDLNGPWVNLARSTGGAATAALLGGVSASETGTGATRSVEVRDIFAIGDSLHPRRFMRLEIVLP